jgi:hypothetical protein
MTPPHITEFIGVYDADGGVVGELRYVFGTIFQDKHCSLCEITHGRVKRKNAWDQACEGLPAPFTLLHLNERTPQITSACTDGVPTILVRLSDNSIRPILGPEELEVGGDVTECMRRIRSAMDRHGLT